MKKYFIKGTQNELHFGDKIETSYSKKLTNGKTAYRHIYADFYPDLIPWLLEEDIIEEISQEDKGLDFEFDLNTSSDYKMNEADKELFAYLLGIKTELKELKAQVNKLMKQNKNAGK